MKLTGQEREAARLMHHLMGYGTNHCSIMFGVWASSMRRILKNKPMPKYRNFRNGHYQKDRQEILEYIAKNGPVSRWDLELCLHHDKDPVLGHLAALQKDCKIERIDGKYMVTA